jgi:hypothetical protein
MPQNHGIQASAYGYKDSAFRSGQVFPEQEFPDLVKKVDFFLRLHLQSKGGDLILKPQNHFIKK